MRITMILLLLLPGATFAAEFLTAGVDPGRTGWVKDESVFTTSNLGSMKLLWKTHLDSTPREMHNLFPPLVLTNVQTSQGTKELAVIAGISDDVWGIDTATGTELWHRKWDSNYTPVVTGGFGGQGGTLCPGGQLAAPTSVARGDGQYTIYAVSWDGRLRQINAADGADLAPAAKFMPPNTKPWSLNYRDGVVYTGISQGCGNVPFSYFSFEVATQTSSAFLPGGGGLWGRRGPAIAYDGSLWMGTGDGYYEPASKHYGNALVGVKLQPDKSLQMVGYFAPPNANWLWHRDLDINVSPIAIDYKGKHLLITTSKECRVWLVDQDTVANMDTTPAHQMTLDRSDLICNPGARYDAAGVWGSMAAWIQKDQLYIAVPFLGPLASSFKAPTQIGTTKLGGVAVFKVDANWKLVPVWTFGDIDTGDEAVYANGVLFVNGAGEDTYQGAAEVAWNEPPRKTGDDKGFGGGSSRRIANSRHASIYAFDALTGKLLWSTGDQITSFNHGSGMTAVNGKAYIGTYDGNLYAFGVAH